MVYVPDYQKEYQKKYREKNPEYYKNHCANLKQHAYNYIESGKIIDTRKWDHWCYKIKSSAKTNINGALIGGFVGVVIGIASKQNFYITGIIGLVLGRLLIKSFTK